MDNINRFPRISGDGSVSRATPTELEAQILLNAQRDYIQHGNTAIRCPRCNKSLEYRCGQSGAAILCVDEACIVVYTRGI